MAPPGVTRYARGAQRRDLLVEAAAGVLLEEGLAALSHRAVAARAGLPLASTTYYFRSADDLRDQALQHLAETWSAHAAAVLETLPAELDAGRAARAVVGILGADAAPRRMLLAYERQLDAGRHERLRPVVLAWNGRLKAVVREVLLRAGLPADGDATGLVLAVADGAAVTALAEGRSPDVAVAAALDRILTLLGEDGPGRTDRAERGRGPDDAMTGTCRCQDRAMTGSGTRSPASTGSA